MRVLREGRLRACFAVFMAVLVVMIAVMPVNVFASEGELRYEMRSGPAIFGNDLILTGERQAVFHQQTLAQSDVEDFNLSIPATADGIDLGPIMGSVKADGITETDGASSNILPFGLVNLAFPSIAETSLQSSSYTCTGFFTANTLRPLNHGAAPIGVGQFGNPSPVIPAKFSGSSLLYPEMICLGNLQKPKNPPRNSSININSMRISLPPTPPASNIAAGIAIQKIGNTTTPPSRQVNNTSINQIYNPSTSNTSNTLPKANREAAGSTIQMMVNAHAPPSGQVNNTRLGQFFNEGANNTNTPLPPANQSNISNPRPSRITPLLLSEPVFYMNAPAHQIDNMSLVERMWRNSHMNHDMDFAYEGDTSYPTWIAPVSPLKLVGWLNQKKANDYSLSMTLPGMNILPEFWDL